MKNGHHNKHGEHENSDRWLLTYADLITLLLGLFVILYAMSKIDAGKYAEIVSALGGVFGSPQGVLVGQNGLLEQPLTSLQSERKRVAGEIRSALALDTNPTPIQVTENERGVTVHIMEELLFPSGRAEIKPSSYAAIDTLARILRRLPNDLRVEGHTDNVPISTPQFPSNWHLSVGRAVAVGYYLITQHGLVAERVSVVGYSEYRPLVDNDTPEHRALNRRVDIVIITGVGHGKEAEESAARAENAKSERGTLVARQ
jgi:chemotaxis protein MotB